MMAQESEKKVCVDKGSVFAWLSELCPKAIPFFNSRGTSATILSPKTINVAHGKRLCDAIYALHEPKEQVDVEIVFIHGFEFDGYKEAYLKTWLARDGTQDNCWPETWLVEKFPYGRILSLSYDASVVQTSTSGRMDLYGLGESLVQEMTLVGIGQHECPVVFVCHSFGGLVAKQIVVTASRNLQHDREVENLFCNLRAFYFYATPHAGVQVGFSPLNPFTSKGFCMNYLEVFSPEVGRLNFEFEQIRREVYNNEWICYSVGEMHASLHGRVVVLESSARQVGGRFLLLNASHFDICKPKNKEDSGFLFLVDCISKVIKVHEKQHHLLELPSGLVGMDDMKKRICEKLGIVSIVGLVGMGGIGKTTMSKCVFNSQTKFYDRTCFLQDVRSKGVASNQKELLEQLCGEKVGNRECLSEVQLRSIQQCIMERRVLLVIDDVGDSQTLKDLQVPIFQKSCSSGSQVIVTCRNRQVLENHVGMEGLKDVEMMEVEFLNDAQALKLFQYHVFYGIEDKDDEMEDFQGLGMDIAKACCGLPLSLEVIGQHLRKQHVHHIGTQREIWEEALRKLHAAQSFDGGDENEVLWKRLKISYDDLDNETKCMFLDFACFFCEKSSIHLSEQSIGWIWNSPIGLQILLARSLIKVGSIDSCGRSFTIHDQLRDMGRRIVKDLSLERLHVSSKYMTRLWDANEILRFFEENQGSRFIEGISFRECFKLATLQARADPRLKQEMTIERFNRLRLLDLTKCGTEVVDFCLRKCWKELSWLCLDGVFDMVIPQAIEEIGFCTGLRVLQMRSCFFLKELPASIGNLVHLLELDLSYCSELQGLPCEIGHLKRLKRLQLCGCNKLKEVPSCVNQLTNLEYLGLALCSSVVSMVEFETQMDHLYELNLSFCKSLQIPFKSLGKLHNLRTLDMYLSKHLIIENPSESFGQLSRFEKLNLHNCFSFIPELCLDSYFGEHALEKVESLWDPVIKRFSFCLRELDLFSISHAGFPKYLNLKVLEVHNRFDLEELPASLGDLTQLERLTIWDHGSLKKLPTSLSKLVKLERLNLLTMWALDGLPDIFGHLCSLKNLEIYDMRKIEELPMSLGELSQLKSLSLKGCMNLKCLPISSTSLTQLLYLDLTGCDALKVMDASQEFFLQELEQCGCCISLLGLHQDVIEDMPLDEW